jgi:hypothetical protein
MALQGHLESVQEDGLITGWCWDPDDASRSVRLQVFVDNDPVGSMLADTFRADLEAAGIGDGTHAFSFLLPWSAISVKSVSTIRVCDTETGHFLGGAITFRRAALIPVEQRLLELEHGLRLLEARLSDARAHAAREASLTRSMLGAVGAFFTRLAEMPSDVIAARGSGSIGELLASVGARYESLTLAVPKSPALTICVSSDSDLDETVACLRSIHVSGLDTEAEIILLDSGVSAELALISSFVQNLRYWRLAPGTSQAEARNRVAQLGEREVIVFLSPAIRMTIEWFVEVRATFAAQPDCAAIASCVVRTDGTVQASGLLPDRTGRLGDFAYAEQADVPQLDRLMPVAATSEVALAIRGSVFTALKGFDPGYVENTASITDLCLRCWDAGYSILYQPSCRLRWPDDGGLGGFGGAANDPGVATFLADRWERSPRLAWPRAKGRALLLDHAEMAETTDIIAHSDLLQRLGYDVSFGNIAGLGTDPACGALLRAMGVVVLRAPFNPSVAATIRNASPAFAVIELTANAAAVLAPETIRSLSATSHIVLRLDRTVEVRLAADATTSDAARLQTSIQSSDGVITTSASMAKALRKAKGPAVLSLAHMGADTRRGIWLLLDGETEAVVEAEEWLPTLLPMITKALPKTPIHTMTRPGIRFPPGIKQHATAAVPALLGTFRLALAPFKQHNANPDALAACLAAGLPIVVTKAALGDKNELPGTATVAANAQAITRQLRKLDSDDEAWAALAIPLVSAATKETWVTGYRRLLTALSLKSH